MKILGYNKDNLQLANLSKLVISSQELMREYAYRQLQSHYPNHEAKIRSHSSVSQRDIERVLKIYQWLVNCYTTSERAYKGRDLHRHAIMIALGLVYYMRLNKSFREEYRSCIDNNITHGQESFQDAFNDELNFYINSIELPTGIAKTQALKENIFATIVCTVTRTPLIIVGAPGSSKTLSFNIVISHLKGQESKEELFRNRHVYPALDPHYYQCSKRTTSAEVETVFLRAKNRQLVHSEKSFPRYCVVFMDEAGLPEESHESLKVLHYYLDESEVSFVAITNHVLDAAKTNRAISLFRPESAEDDLEVLAKGCLSSENLTYIEILRQLCSGYLSITNNNDKKNNKKFFGLRDFIHFVNYLRRFMKPNGDTFDTVMRGLERNFNGFDNFSEICGTFLEKVSIIG